MSDNRYAIPKTETRSVDQGLRSYMQNVYNAMAVGLVFTGAVAFAVASTPALLMATQGTVMSIIIMLAPFGILLFGLNPRRVQTMSIGAVAGLYLLFTGLFGLSLSYIFLMYTAESLARVFFITAGMFAATSIYGYTTKRDLSGLGSLMFMGLIGLVIASIVNIFLQSSMLHFVVSGIGVLVFTGMTAWDTQRIKEIYHASYGRETLTKMAIMGALSLYLDFINLFMFLLQFIGDRR